MSLEGKIVVVTGAAGGFGEGIARLFAQRKAKVVVVDLRAQEAERVAADIRFAGGIAHAVSADVSKSESVARLAAYVKDELGALDVLVNNAGITHRNAPMLEVPEEMFDRVFAVNVKSIYLTAVHLIPLMRAGSCVVNIASTAGVRPRPGLTWYNGSKGAVISLTKSMAAELAPRKIRVNAINPVMGDTGMLQALLPGEDTAEVRQRVLSTIPLGRFSTPADIARATAFLASAEAELITGACLEVDGGRCI